MKTIFRTSNYQARSFKDNILSNGEIYNFKLNSLEINTSAPLSVVYKKKRGQKRVLEGVKILLVEDDKINRLIVNNILKQQNVDLTKVKNGVEAVEILKKESFDLILMDIQMPNMNGIEATSIIRNELKNQVPIIALTANSFGDEIDEVLEVGMNDFLIKPFEEQDLINVIEKYYKMFSKKKDESLEGTGENTTFKKLYDLEKLEGMSKGNVDFLKKMCNLFVKITPDYLKKINSLYEERNISSLKKLAHKMKPSIDYMGIVSIKQDIRDLEHLNNDNYSLEKLKSLVENVINTLSEVVLQIRKKELL